MKAGFLEKLIERLGRIGPEEVKITFCAWPRRKVFWKPFSMRFMKASL